MQTFCYTVGPFFLKDWHILKDPKIFGVHFDPAVNLSAENLKNPAKVIVLGGTVRAHAASDNSINKLQTVKNAAIGIVRVALK